jgi:A/G-specific adenine glycosylase
MFLRSGGQEFRHRLLRWYSANGRDLPWRRTRDPYAILVSEIMLQQTQVSTVRPYYERWLNRFPDFTALADASESDVLHTWQGLGYYSRARNLHAAAKIVVREHRACLPSEPELLRKLPGMGRYTANAVATFAFNQAMPIVEANITRVIARLFNVEIPVDSTAGREQLWQTAASLVPKRDPAKFNSALMDLGALVCGRTPRCVICPVHHFCRAKQPELLPRKKPRPRLKCLTESHSFALRRGRILLEQCTDRWRGMWMLPPFQPNGSRDRQIHSSLFPFTHHRVTLRVFRKTAARHPTNRQRWISVRDLETTPIPSPHRRAINACLQLSVGHGCQSGSDR